MGMDVVGIEPRSEEGKYFRASVWGWRPLRHLIEEANQRFGLGLDLQGFDENAGHGLSTQEPCDRLAACLEKLVAEHPLPTFTLDLEPQGIEGLVAQKLQAAGWLTPPADAPHYRIAVDDVREFIGFLRSSGGFEIW